jgi:hypothetical protein
MTLDITNVTDFIKSRVAEFDSEIDTSDGTAFADLVIKPVSTILQPLVDEAIRIADSQSLLNASTMSESDLDALVANYFINRRAGSRAFGSVRIYFRVPTAFTIPIGTPFQTEDGVRFVASTTVTISEVQMGLQPDGSFYVMDVPIQAESAGTTGNVDANTITVFTTLGTQVVRVTNPDATTSGTSTETNEELAERAALAITVRDLVTEPGIITVMLEEFPQIVSLQTFGFGDDEMERDILTSEDDMQLGDLEIIDPADGVHIGGKVDIITKVLGISLETIDVSPVTEILILRPQDEFDELPIPATWTFLDDFVRPEIQIQSIEELGAVTGEPNGNVLVEGRTYFAAGDGVLTPNTGLGTSTFTSVTAQFQTDGLPATSGYITIISGSPTVGAVVTTTYQVLSIDSENQLTVDGEVDLAFGSLGYEAGTGDFEFTVDAPTLRFSVKERDRIRFKNDPSGFSLTAILAANWRISYQVVNDIADFQTFVDADENRVVCSDLLVKFAQPAFVSMSVVVTIDAASDATTSTLQNAVVEFVNNLGVGDALEASDIVNVLYDNGATFVDLPFDMTVEFVDRFGNVETVVDDSRIEIDRTSTMIPESIQITEA